ncbi:insulinase family protein [Patescibacteria group bacterium]|nr:insulinase family protein [Patescibacteria group bacterium]
MFKQIKLKNGIKVILAPRAQTRAVSVLVLMRVGSRYENSSNNGISHFVEHLMFKGTKKRPSTLDISQELDSIGADYNAFTSKEATGYYIKAGKENLDLACDLLSDMLIESTFVQEEIERERGIILEEINMYEDNPMSKIGDFFEEDLFGENTSLGQHVIGTPQNIKSIKRADIVSYWQKHYKAGNLLIAISGNFNEKSALSVLEEKFGIIKKSKRNAIRPARVLSSKAKFCAHHKKTNQAHLMLGFPSISSDHKDRYALGVLNIILGGNMSSRLFIQVRERLGLCYFITSGAEMFEDTGAFYIHAGLDLKNVDKALDAVSKELRDIKENPVAKEELLKAKQFIKGKMALSQEDSLEIASFYAGQAMNRKKILTPEQVFAKIDKVKASDVRRVACDILNKKKAHLTTLSPFKDIHKFDKNLDF